MTRLRATSVTFRRPDGVAADAVVSVFRVPPEVAGQRLDVFVQSQLRRTSRTRTQYIVRLSAYDADGRRLRTNDRVYAHQHILLWRAPWDEAAVATDVPVLYEDMHLLAINKPANLPVHPTARYYKNTLIKVLQATRPGEFLALGHRLDRETSGVVLIAKTLACERVLKRQFQRREGIAKSYLAFTWGDPSAATGKRRFRFERPVRLDPASPYRVKMIAGDHPDGLHAVTTFEVLATVVAGGRTYARVRCELETGRQHQIRVHLKDLGAPIVGDKLYGPDEACFARSADGQLTLADLALLELPRHALHASCITLDHPVTGAALTIEAPAPDDMHAFWEGLVRDAAV